jgi:hypothetical protein
MLRWAKKMDLKILLGIIATVVGLIGYVPYFRDVFRGRTKPHVFSWFVWGVLTTIAFIAQLVEDAGPGSWVTGSTAVICLVIAWLALSKGEREITRFDWFCFIAALFGVVLWILTSNPLLAVVIVTITDALAYIPTFRKTYFKPHEETLIEYALGSLKFLIGLFALQSFEIVNWLYPASLVLMNGLFVIMALIRRKQLARQGVLNG